MESVQRLDCKDLHGYVLTLPASVLDQLYGHPATCLAIFRFVTSLHLIWGFLYRTNLLWLKIQPH